MTERARSNPTRHRVAWTVFWVVSVLAVGAGVVAAVSSGHERYVVAIVMVGLCWSASRPGPWLALPAAPGYDGGRVPGRLRSPGERPTSTGRREQARRSPVRPTLSVSCRSAALLERPEPAYPVAHWLES